MEGQLHELARSGDVSQLAVAIAKFSTDPHRSKHHPLDARDKHGRTALMLAAYEGHVEVLQLLVAEGASVHTPAQDDMTALHFAASKGQSEAVRFLLDAGVKANRKTQRLGNTPLHLAAKGGHADTVAVLLRRKGDAAATNRQGATAADLATDAAVKETLQAAVAEAEKLQEERKEQAAKRKESREAVEAEGGKRLRKTAQEQSGDDAAEAELSSAARGGSTKKPKISISYDEEDSL